MRLFIAVALLVTTSAVDNSRHLRVAFGSCVDPDNVSFYDTGINHAFQMIADQNPDVYVHTGDFVYPDLWGNSPWKEMMAAQNITSKSKFRPKVQYGDVEKVELCPDQGWSQPNTHSLLCIPDDTWIAEVDDIILRKLAKVNGTPGWQALRNRADIYFTLDDHDFGVNDFGADFPYKEEMKELFMENFPKDTEWDPKMKDREGMYQVYTHRVGGFKIQLILLDDQSFRPHEDDDHFGPAQERWIEKQFQRDFDFRIIIQGSPWTVFRKHDQLTAKPGSFKRFIGLLEKYDLDETNSVHIVGDWHWSYSRVAKKGDIVWNGGYNHTNVEALPVNVWEVMSSGLTQGRAGFKTGLYVEEDSGPWKNNCLGTEECAAFWENGDKAANGQVRDLRGEIYQNFTLEDMPPMEYMSYLHSFGVLDFNANGRQLDVTLSFSEPDPADNAPTANIRAVKTVRVSKEKPEKGDERRKEYDHAENRKKSKEHGDAGENGTKWKEHGHAGQNGTKWKEHGHAGHNGTKWKDHEHAGENGKKWQEHGHAGEKGKKWKHGREKGERREERGGRPDSGKGERREERGGRPDSGKGERREERDGPPEPPVSPPRVRVVRRDADSSDKGPDFGGLAIAGVLSLLAVVLFVVAGSCW